MKKLTILVVTLLLMAMTAQAQAIEKLLNKYSNNESCSYVSLSADLLQFGLSFVDKKSADVDSFIKNELSKITGLKVLTVEKEKEADQKLMDEIMQELNNILKKDSKSEPIIETKDKGEVTKIYLTGEGLILMTKEPDELSIVFISGELSKQAIKDIISKANKK
ncbi:MAG: DUF4252 domain-containing protein [Prevotellaceae bacterium]|jgi:hypothetical protein|nr:DUF4252 domain-containing protein [Prevotellaceae bacterium]